MDIYHLMSLNRYIISYISEKHKIDLFEAEKILNNAENTMGFKKNIDYFLRKISEEFGKFIMENCR